MTNRYTGGVLSATAPTVSQITASGVWNVEEAQYYQKAGLWPDGSGADPYFNYTTLLLHGDGTNGAQNNTFVDSSTNLFNVTRTGNTTQGAYSPYFSTGCWSNYFDGSGDYLTCGGSASIAFGSGDFTLEMWILPTAGTSKMLYDARPSAVAGLYPTLYINASNAIAYYTNGADRITGAAPTLNVWQHIAVVRSSGVTKLYINGTQSGSSYTDSNTYINGAARPVIGADGGTLANQNYAGYISNLRVVVGVAIYTNTFTPPTTPLTATAQTTLLICNSNAFLDKSTTNNTITRVGNTSISKFSPFSAQVQYSASTYGGSAYFDGTGDYLTLPAPSALAIGTGNFTFETWIYSTSLAATQYVYDNCASGDGTGTGRFAVVINTDGTLRLVTLIATNLLASAAGAVSANQWLHIAISRSGTTGYMFVNGVQVATATVSTNFLAVTASGTNRPMIGSNGNNALNPFVGYMANMRVVVGTAVYTAAFTPPTTPVTAISNTQLLLNMVNGGIFDNTTVNDLETVGSAQISTSVVKYGSGSIYYPSAGSFLTFKGGAGIYTGATVAGSGIFYAGNTFTIEAWMYPTTKVSAAGFYSLILGDASTTSGALLYWAVGLNSSGVPTVAWNDGVAKTATGTTVISNNTWTHLAFVVTAGVVKIYVNGVSETLSGTTTITTPSSSTGLINSGVDRVNYWLGNLDDLRVTNGVARYSANFTPPGPFPNY